MSSVSSVSSVLSVSSVSSVSSRTSLAQPASGHSSEVISGHQRSSEVISPASQWPFKVNAEANQRQCSGHQRPFVRGHQRSSEVISGHQRPFVRGHSLPGRSCSQPKPLCALCPPHAAARPTQARTRVPPVRKWRRRGEHLHAGQPDHASHSSPYSRATFGPRDHHASSVILGHQRVIRGFS